MVSSKGQVRGERPHQGLFNCLTGLQENNLFQILHGVVQGELTREELTHQAKVVKEMQRNGHSQQKQDKEDEIQKLKDRIIQLQQENRSLREKLEARPGTSTDFRFDGISPQRGMKRDQPKYKALAKLIAEDEEEEESNGSGDMYSDDLFSDESNLFHVILREATLIRLR